MTGDATTATVPLDQHTLAACLRWVEDEDALGTPTPRRTLDPRQTSTRYDVCSPRARRWLSA